MWVDGSVACTSVGVGGSLACVSVGGCVCVCVCVCMCMCAHTHTVRCGVYWGGGGGGMGRTRGRVLQVLLDGFVVSGELALIQRQASWCRPVIQSRYSLLVLQTMARRLSLSL